MALTEEQKEIALRIAEQFRASVMDRRVYFGMGADDLFFVIDRFLAALPKPEAVGHQYQDDDGKWREFINQKHYENTLADGTWMIRAIYAEAPIAPPTSEQKSAWQPIETAPRDNKCPLYLARINENGELLEIDFDGGWEFWRESYEMPHICGLDWCSANGIEEPTHWAFQDAPLPPAPQPEQENYKAQRNAERLNADTLREPINGDEWRVEWWNESCRMMLPAGMILDCFQAYKNGTLQFTIKKRAAIASVKGGA